MNEMIVNVIYGLMYELAVYINGKLVSSYQEMFIKNHFLKQQIELYGQKAGASLEDDTKMTVNILMVTPDETADVETKYPECFDDIPQGFVINLGTMSGIYKDIDMLDWEMKNVDELSQPCYVMINIDGRYFNSDGRNSKNWKKATVETYYDWYETLVSMYEEGWGYDRWKWDSCGIIRYGIMRKAEEMRRISEKDFSEYLNNDIGRIYVNYDCYHFEPDHSRQPDDNCSFPVRVIWDGEPKV